jgi:hypothetical protein
MANPLAILLLTTMLLLFNITALLCYTTEYPLLYGITSLLCYIIDYLTKVNVKGSKSIFKALEILEKLPLKP